MPLGPNDIDLTGKTITGGTMTGTNISGATGAPAAAIADADYGDVAVSGSGTVWTVQSVGTVAFGTLATQNGTFSNAVLTGGALGTPSSGTLTSCSGLPAAGVVGTALVTGGALGTPASGTLTSCSGLPAAGVVGTAIVNGGALGTPSGGTLTSCTGLPAAGVVGTAIVNGGALGTPSSGTLSSCGSLPVSGITASTVTPIGVGSVELGHASDTTIARVGAGLVSVEGAYLNSEQYAFVPTGSDFSMGANGNVQSYLPAATDTFTCLANTTYFFETMIYTTQPTTTTRTTAFSLKGGGNATIAATLWHATHMSAAAIGTQAATATHVFAAVATAIVLNATNTSASGMTWVRGQFRVSTVGTIIPSIQFSVAPGVAVPLSKAGTYFRCWPVGTDTTASVGAWA